MIFGVGLIGEGLQRRNGRGSDAGNSEPAREVPQPGAGSGQRREPDHPERRDSGAGGRIRLREIRDGHERGGVTPRKQCDYSGQILLDGQELLHAERSALRKIQGRTSAWCFRSRKAAWIPWMKIGPQVEETLRIHTDLSRTERQKRALAAMAEAEAAGAGDDLWEVSPRAVRRDASAGHDRRGHCEPAQAAAAG